MKRAVLALLAVVIAGAASSAALLLRHAVPPSDAPLGDRTRCAAYSGLPAHWREDPHAGMQRIAGGQFDFGSLRGYADERPLQATSISAFWIDRTEVSNAQFASFVAATAYVTEAERGDGAAVFRIPASSDELRPGRWWSLQSGASWRHPDGADSDLSGREHEPVVNVTLADAQAYAHWLGRELPSEAQWEYAAKAGRSDAEADASLRDAHGKPLANFWQGLFPLQNRDEDGFAGRAPVGCFAANGYGLHDMIGNVWEWTRDPYRVHGAASNDADAMPLHAQNVAARYVIKGGSYLCADNYCVRARAAARQAEEANLPASHLGFRTVAPG